MNRFTARTAKLMVKRIWGRMVELYGDEKDPVDVETLKELILDEFEIYDLEIYDHRGIQRGGSEEALCGFFVWGRKCPLSAGRSSRDDEGNILECGFGCRKYGYKPQMTGKEIIDFNEVLKKKCVTRAVKE